MQFNEIIKKENHPLLQLLLLGVYMFVGAIVGVLFGLVVCLPFYGLDLVRNMDWVYGTDAGKIGALKILLTGQQLGMFLLPALALPLTERINISKFYNFSKPTLTTAALVVLIMICATPFIGYINELNQHMHLPSFLKGLENWMIAKEKEAAITTEAILNVKSIGGLFVNLLVIALVPAVCEEFIFRGALQRIVQRIMNNHHLAIWISAIIFSAIHLQFFGFFPRLILGATFGYIYFYTKSLWYTVLAHFLNNAYAVIISYYYRVNNLPTKELDEMKVPVYVAVISIILTIVLLKFLRDRPQIEKDPIIKA